MKKFILAALLAGASVAPVQAAPVTVNFNTINYNQAWTESGFTFTISNDGHNDGTTYLLPHYGNVTLTSAGGAFDLLSFQLVDFGYGDFTLTSDKGDSLVIDNSAPGLKMVNFMGVNTVTMTQGVYGGYFRMDNVALNDTPSVPEPAMLGLFGLGAIGLGLARRKRA